MSNGSPFLELSNDIMLLIIDELANLPPRLDSRIRYLTPLKHLSVTNRRMRELVFPTLFKRIALENHLEPVNWRWSSYDFHLPSSFKAIEYLSATPGICDTVRKFSFHTQNATSRTITARPRYDIMVTFIGSLSRPQHLTLCIGDSFALFEDAIHDYWRDIALRFETITTLHISEQGINLLCYCPNVRNLALSRAPGELTYDSTVASGVLSMVALHVTHLEADYLSLVCRVARLTSLSPEFPDTEVLRLTERYLHSFHSWSRRVGNCFKHVRVLAVSRQFFAGYIGFRKGNDTSFTPFVGADDIARWAFVDIATLEELWLEPDNIARRVRSSTTEADAGDAKHRGSQEDEVGPYSQIEATQWVWTRPSDPLVRHIEWIV